MPVTVGILLAMLSSAPSVTQTGACAPTRVEDSLARQLERSSERGDGWRVTVDIRERSGPEFVAEVEIYDPAGGVAQRTVTSQSCAVAADAVAFMIASALAAPQAEGEPEPPEPIVPEPKPDPEPEPEPPPDAPVSESRPAGATPRTTEPAPPDVAVAGWLGLDAGVMGGALPGVVGRLRLAGGVEGPRWRAGLGVSASTRADARASGVSSVGADLGHWAVDAQGCGVLRRGRWSVPLCGELEVGQLYASGFGFAGARTIVLPWGAALVSAGVGVDLGKRWRIVGRASAGGVLNRATIVIDNLGTVHRLGPVFGRGSLGLELRI